MIDKTQSKMIDSYERRNLTMELRKAGLTYQKISEQVIAKFGLKHLPKGYDRVYAHKDVRRELDKIINETTENVKDIRQIELERLDTMLTSLWKNVRKGNVNEFDRIIKIMDRRSKYLGLDSAEKHEYSGEVVLIEPPKKVEQKAELGKVEND